MRSIPPLATLLASVLTLAAATLWSGAAPAQTTLAQASPSVAKRMNPPPPPAGSDQSRLSALTEQLNQNTVTVVSGNTNGTYLYLAYDMSAVLDDGTQLRILPVIGKGGYQNMIDLLHLRGIDLAITQSNIMTYLKRTGEMGPNIDQRVAYIAKLYNEEMHVLAGQGIKRIQDLAGKKVNFSDVGSGTQFSTRLIFDLLGIKCQEVNVGQADGYQMVKSGEIAATILIAGKPTGAFSKFKLESGMTLLPVPYVEALETDYFPAKLTSEDYPNLIEKGQSIETVAVGAVLAAYNWPKDTDRYRRVAQFTETFFNRFADFQRLPRHVKWRETNLSASLRNWKRFPAAEEWLARPPKATAVVIDPGIVRAQAAKVAPNDPAMQEKLFRDFMEWHKAQQQKR
ncbi:MAG: TAXI family TRAP transporter solute-binding subunit [Hyphomicrobiaceae bacterium]|nr:TAXI family TRAP transporter solute-binding subunit [Hyphomicrobiaceae bacterium]